MALLNVKQQEKQQKQFKVFYFSQAYLPLAHC
jgi:hypothetical protein